MKCVGVCLALRIMMQCQNPLFEIRQIYPQGIMPIDLCEDCSKKFIEWVGGGRTWGCRLKKLLKALIISNT